MDKSKKAKKCPKNASKDTTTASPINGSPSSSRPSTPELSHSTSNPNHRHKVSIDPMQAVIKLKNRSRESSTNAIQDHDRLEPSVKVRMRDREHVTTAHDTNIRRSEKRHPIVHQKRRKHDYPSTSESDSIESSDTGSTDDSSNGIENVCSNIDKYLDELERNMSTSGDLKRLNSSSISTFELNKGSNSMASELNDANNKCADRRTTSKSLSSSKVYINKAFTSIDIDDDDGDGEGELRKSGIKDPRFSNNDSASTVTTIGQREKSLEQSFLALPYQNMFSALPVSSLESSYSGLVSMGINGNHGGQIVRLQWRNLSYTSSNRRSFLGGKPNRHGGRKLILDQQSGEIRGGTLTAIIGPSGAGKSTLLSCLAGRLKQGVSGDINIICDSTYLASKKLIRISFIGQKDQLIGNLTVRETLMFSTKLKNVHYHHQNNHYYHKKLVDSIIESLRLERCANVRVGSISGGQLKRLTFAIEIISGPDIIILDEPTSGLDSSATAHCIKLFRKLTDLSRSDIIYNPPAIVCTIHQPSARVLNTFHSIYVLSCDGRCIYHGQPGDLVDHLARFGLNCPEFHNPADFIVEIASGDHGYDSMNRLAANEKRRQLEQSTTVDSSTANNNNNNNSDRSRRRDGKSYSSNGANRLCKSTGISAKHSRHSTMAYNGKDTISTTVSSSVPLALSSSSSSSLSPFSLAIGKNENQISVQRVVNRMKSQSFPRFSHFWLLLHRTYLITVRDLKLTLLRFGQALFIGALMSLLYDYKIGEPDGCYDPTTWISGQSNSNGQSASISAVQSTQDNIAFIFFITLFTVMSCMMPTVLTFPLEVRVHIQERNNGWYSGWTYYWSKIIADTPYQILISGLFCAIVYPATGQIWILWRFCMFILNTIIVSNIAQCVGMLFGTIYVKSVQNAVFMAPLSMAPVFLLSGFFGRISKVPIILKPIAYISYVRYAFESFLIILYGYGRCVDLPAYPELFHTTMMSVGDSNNNNNNHNNGNNINESSVEYTGNVQYFRQRPIYDSLPKVWPGFYNPMDYLETADRLIEAELNIKRNTMRSGSAILEHFELIDDDLWWNMAILMAILLILRLFTYLMLIIKTNQ